MRILRIILAALVVSVLNSVWGFFTCGLWFSWVYLLPPVTIWRAPIDMTPAFWVFNYIGHFILTIIFVAVLRLIANGLPGKWLVKGLSFGIIVWLVGILPGMFATFMFMTVNPIWVGYMTLNQLVWLPIMGLVAATIVLPRKSSLLANVAA